MNPKDILEAFFLQIKTANWNNTPTDIKGKMFNYIMSVCIQKDLTLTTKIMRQAQAIPIGVEWATHRAFILDYYRKKFVCDKTALYQITWFSFPKKIEEKEVNVEAIEYGLRLIGKSHELQEFLKGDRPKDFVGWCEEEWKFYQKYNK